MRSSRFSTLCVAALLAAGFSPVIASHVQSDSKQEAKPPKQKDVAPPKQDEPPPKQTDAAPDAQDATPAKQDSASPKQPEGTPKLEVLLPKETAPAKAAEREVRALMEKVTEAALKGDAAFFQSYFDDDLVRVEARGQMVPKEVALLAMKTGAVKYQMLEARELQVRIFGDTAVVNVIYDFRLTRNGKKFTGPNRVMRVLVKREGKWREVSFQATQMQDQESGVRIEEN